MREVDAGYLVHCLLGEVFGDHAPQPFDLQHERGREMELLAYSSHDREVLKERADVFADPERHAAIDWERFHQKTMPASWPEGLTLGFQVRACPVVRAASDTEHYSKGSEVDAFLTRCAEADKGEEVPSREAVYRDWLGEQLGRRGGAELLDARLNSFQLRKLTRRTQGGSRTARVFTRPDVRLAGQLQVVDSDAFCELLAGGIGRHRAFGFGMILLRPS
jgi:CRISPR system Cascade subunit CasE